MKLWRAHRAAIFLLFVGLLGATTLAWGQFANKTGNVVGTVGGACTSSANDYAWPDTNGDILKCVSNVWTLVTQSVAAAGSTGYVQFNSSNALAGSANLFWNNSSGYLGIGTTSPNTTLHVRSATNEDMLIGPAVTVTGATTLSAVNDAVTANIPLEIRASLTDFAAGNVGIGTTSPGYLLSLQQSSAGTLGPQIWVNNSGGAVADAEALTLASNGSARAQIKSVVSGGSTSYNGDIEFYTGQGSLTEDMVIGPTGLVGIGTTAPAASLDVINYSRVLGSANGAGGVPASGKGLESTFDTAANVGYITAFNRDTSTSLDLSLGPTPVSLYIKASGLVGIGTTSPTEPLHSYMNTNGLYNFLAQTGSSATARVDVENSAGHYALAVGVTGVAANDFAIFDAAASAARLYVNSTGNVGIGTTAPAYLLHVGSASASGIVEELQNSSGACTFTPSSSALITICSSDQRLKEDIENATPALPQLADMRVRSYTIKASGERATGVIAQEMLWKHPELVHMGPEGMYGVEAPNVWLLVKAIQELKAANDDLTDRLSADDDALKSATDSIADLHESFEEYKSAHP